jgi:hypothetical protein
MKIKIYSRLFFNVLFLTFIFSPIFVHGETFVAPKEIDFISPTSSTVWETGSRVTVAWASNTKIPEIELSLVRDDGINLVTAYSISNAINAEAGVYSFILPSQISAGEYRVRAAGKGGVDELSPFFKIVKPIIKPELLFTSPGEKSIWKAGEKQTITWTSNTNLEEITLGLVQKGYDEKLIASGIKTQQGSYSFLLSRSTIQGIYQIRASGKGGLEEYSHEFKIVPADPLPPEIIFTHPSKGGVFGAGRSVKIIWEPHTDVSWIMLDLVRGDGTNTSVVQGITRNISTQSREYNFIIDSRVVSGDGYRIRATGKGGLLEYSDFFGIKNEGSGGVITPRNNNIVTEEKKDESEGTTQDASQINEEKKEQILGMVARIQERYIDGLSGLSFISKKIDEKIKEFAVSRDMSEVELLNDLTKESLRKAEQMNDDLSKTINDILLLDDSKTIAIIIEELRAVRAQIFLVHSNLVDVVGALRATR